MLALQMRPAPCKPCASTTSSRPVTKLYASRRDFMLSGSLAAISLLLAGKEKAAEAAQVLQPSSSSAGNAGQQPATPSSSFISMAPSDFKGYMDERDEAMEIKCKVDCDGDRSEFAKKQYNDWLAAGGVPKRLREGRPNGPKSY